MNLEYDIRRSILLSNYIEHWGMPSARNIMTRGEDIIELYSFPSDLIQRYATVGLSSCTISDSSQINSELFLAVPREIAAEQPETISNYIFDIVAHLINTLGKNVKPGDLVPTSPIAPPDWPNALLFDEPRGEPEEIALFHVGVQHVELIWVVPIYENEYDLIKTEGIERFDEAMEEMELSVVDIRRRSCI